MRLEVLRRFDIVGPVAGSVPCWRRTWEGKRSGGARLPKGRHHGSSNDFFWENIINITEMRQVKIKIHIQNTRSQENTWFLRDKVGINKGMRFYQFICLFKG